MSSSVSQTQARTGSDPVFDKAAAKFKKRLTKDQAAKFANCTVDDVRDQIRDIQNRHGAQRRLRNMERISKFVEGMLQLGTVVEVFLNLHNTVALIWGPMKFLLVTASTWIDTLDSLLDVYGQIGEVLPDLTRYRQIYKEYPSVHTHLEAYYCDILQFHSNALDVFARPGWKVLFHSAWKTFKTQFDPILKSLERHRVMLSEEKLTAVMQETQKQGQSIQDKLHQLNRDLQERDKKDAERDLITLQSQIHQQYRIVESKINAPNYHEDYEIASQKPFQSTSGQWIISHPLVSEWLDFRSQADGKIYLSGIPGAGKTVLTSSLITHLKELKSSTRDSGDRFTISYFYFKHDQPKKNSFVSLLLALLAQLVAQDESLLDHVYQACRSIDPQLFRSLDEVSRHVSTALQSQSRCFVIVDWKSEYFDTPDTGYYEQMEQHEWYDDDPGMQYAIRLHLAYEARTLNGKIMADFGINPKGEDGRSMFVNYDAVTKMRTAGQRRGVRNDNLIHHETWPGRPFNTGNSDTDNAGGPVHFQVAEQQYNGLDADAQAKFDDLRNQMEALLGKR